MTSKLLLPCHMITLSFLCEQLNHSDHMPQMESMWQAHRKHNLFTMPRESHFILYVNG